MKTACLLLFSGFLTSVALADPSDIPQLARITPGQTAAQNALWGENPHDKQFVSSKRVVIADIKGPGLITMMHFAYAQSLHRDLLLRIYWDGETEPSVDCPLVDFFCDPNGSQSVINTAFVNLRRGFNAYFPMPFRKSARVELVYDGPLEPGNALCAAMPCYSYVMYRTVGEMPADTGYFHASWRQQMLKLGLSPYIALEAKGKGKLVGWNVTVRHPGDGNYPVDENEKFYIDGEAKPSIEFQGLEDSFGFSWGFPETENFFPLTGYAPFMKGAMAYRFFVQDAISFEKSLKVAIAFGDTETGFIKGNTWYGSSLQLSSTVYWYQQEPHAPLPAMPPAAERTPAPEEPYLDEKSADAAAAAELQSRGVKVALAVGRPGREIVWAAPGYNAESIQGTVGDNWPGDVYYSRSDAHEVQLRIDTPKAVGGVARVYIVDPDNYGGGRKESVTVAGQTLGPFSNFQKGQWIECPVNADKNATGQIDITAINGNPNANAVISKIEWVQK